MEKSFAVRGGAARVRAVDDVSLTLAQGETVGVIGTSGCGKTTLVKLLLGLLTPDGGSVTRRGPVGFVGQDPYSGLCPGMTVEKLVAEPLLFSGQKRRLRDCVSQVEDALSRVHLDSAEYAARLPSQLSGGERQRVAIARALIRKPELLLLDEPTSMLDQEVKDSIADLIRDVSAQQGMAFLMVTHDIRLAARVCGRICVMEQGRLIEQGPSDQVMAAPKAPLTRDLIRISSDIKSYWAEHYRPSRPRI